MTKIEKYFLIAKGVAIANGSDKRKYKIGAVGIRSDGVMVTSRNIGCRTPEPTAHAESRLAKKLDQGAIVFVVRVLSNGNLALAKPCKNCQNALKAKKVRRCYYSINNNKYGFMKL